LSPEVLPPLQATVLLWKFSPSKHIQHAALSFFLEWWQGLNFWSTSIIQSWTVLAYRETTLVHQEQKYLLPHQSPWWTQHHHLPGWIGVAGMIWLTSC
jgi:hypothetical protein